MANTPLEQALVSTCNQAHSNRTVTYTPVVGSPVDIQVIFDNAFIDIEGVMTKKPILRVDLNDLDNIPTKGDTVLIDAVSYKIIESREDGIGGSTLILQKV